MDKPQTEPLNKIALALQIVLMVAPAVMLAAAWGALPETVPAHWGASGIDRWGSKMELLAIPALAVVLGIVAIAGSRIASPRETVGFLGGFRLNERLVVTVSGVVVNVVAIVSLALWIAAAQQPASPQEAQALNWQALAVPIIFIVAGVLLTLRSAGMPDTEPVLGEQYRAHRIGGAVFMVAGVLMGALCAFVLSGTAATICEAVIAAIAMGFFLILVRRWL